MKRLLKLKTKTLGARCKEKDGNEILLALGAGEVATGARIFQAITQVKARVQQNPLRYISEILFFTFLSLCYDTLLS